MKSKTEKFIEKATHLHMGYYSYENVVYEKNNIKVNITCPEHGEFWQRPNAHLNGSGCVSCRYKNLPKAEDPNESKTFDLSTRDGLLEYVNAGDLLNNTRSLSSRKNKEFMERLTEETSYLDSVFDTKDITRKMRLICFVDGYVDVPMCKGGGCKSRVVLSRTKGMSEFCGPECAKGSPLTHKKIGEATGSDEANEKRRKSTVAYYQNLARERGYDNPETYTHSSHFDDVVNKRKDSMEKNWVGGHPLRDPEFVAEKDRRFFEKWGVKNPINIPGMLERVAKDENGEWFIGSKEGRAKTKATMLERYGSENPMEVPSIREKQIATNIERYGRESPNQAHISEETAAILNDKDKLGAMVKDRFFDDVAEELGVHQSSVQRACAHLGIKVKRTTSKAEMEIISLLESYDIKVEHGVRLISSREIDIYLPDYNFGIEYNGMYWHSEEFRYNNYHQEKSLMYKDIGVLLMHVWEDDWNDERKKQIVINKILAKVGVIDREQARKTTVGKLTTSEAREFFDANHIQGHVNGTCYIGLRDREGEVVACMTMREVEDGVWDLSRFASSKQVVGGFSKCLSHFKKLYEWKSIFTFASLDYSHGQMYESTGFVNEGVTAPNMWYMKRGQWIRMGRRRFIKSSLHKKLDNFDPDLSEKDNMRQNGYTIIHDSGSIKYTLTNDQ